MHIFELPPDILCATLTYLQPRDLHSLSTTSQLGAECALDEPLWRALTLRAFPAIPSAYEPPDFLWRAEYLARHTAARRVAAYQRELVLGAAGKRSADTRLTSKLRFDHYENLGSKRALRVAEARGALELAAAKAKATAAAAAAAAAGGGGDIGSPQQAVKRQGFCNWGTLSGAPSGAAAAPSGNDVPLRAFY